MKRLLVITYYWPPSAGSGVQRWLKMSRYLPEYGWQPVIYTPENPESGLRDESLLEDVSQEVEVIRRPIVEPYSIFKSIVGKGAGAVNPINSVGRKTPLMRLSLWLRANVFIPDPRRLWIRPSVKFLLKYLEEHPVDAIASTGPPHSMHLIARQVHRITGIKWIADFRDPWTRIFYFKHLPLTRLSAKRYEAMELSVLREADEVVAVTDRMVQDFMELTGESPGRFHVIENGFDEADFEGISAEVLPEGYNIVHTGLFSAEGNPLKLWRALASLCDTLPGFKEKLHLIFAGKTDPEVILSIKEAGLGDTLTDRGYIRHRDANRLQKGADLLLLPLRQEPEAAGILTGKYFEYLAAGRPIAAFGPHGSVLESSLAATRSGRMFDWDEQAPGEEYIASLFKGQEAFSPDKNAVSAYTRKKLAERYAALLR